MDTTLSYGKSCQELNIYITLGPNFYFDHYVQ